MMHLLFCIGSILIRHDVRLVGAVLADNFFHPNHVIPASEFMGAFIELTYQSKTQTLMEEATCCRNVFVSWIAMSNAGFHVVYVLKH